MSMMSPTPPAGKLAMTSLVSKALADPQPNDTLMLPEVISTTGELARVLKLRQAQDGAQLKTLATAWYQGKLTELTWVQTRPSLVLQSGQLIRFSAEHPGASASMHAIKVQDVRLAANVDPDVFLLNTVPKSWLPEAKANPGDSAAEPSPVEDLSGMWGSLSRQMRAWLNAVFWFQPMRLYWFLCAPASMNHHHARKHGLFIHSVDCAQRAITAAWHDDLVNTDVLLLAALLHDLGKANEYLWNDTKKCWSLSDRGALMGHRLTTLEWMAAARGLLSDNDSPTEMEVLAVYHAINASNAPDWAGLRSPRTPEVFYLASVDGLSGQCDLIRSHAIPNAVRGRYHAQFRGGAYVTASNASQR